MVRTHPHHTPQSPIPTSAFMARTIQPPIPPKTPKKEEIPELCRLYNLKSIFGPDWSMSGSDTWPTHIIGD